MRLKGILLVICSSLGFITAEHVRRREQEAGMFTTLQSDAPSMVPSDFPSNIPSDIPSDSPSDAIIATAAADISEDGASVSQNDRDITGFGDTTRPGLLWEPKGVITSGDRDFGFGEEIDLSGDGLVMSIHDSNAVKVFSRSSSGSDTWSQVGDAIPASDFVSFQLSSDGKSVLIQQFGQLDIVEWDGEKWERKGSPVPKVFSPDSFAAMSADGQTVAIGYPGQRFDFYREVGYVQVYKFSPTTNNWELTFRVDGKPDQERNIGRSVTLSDDGTIMAFAGRGTSASDRMYVDIYDITTGLVLGRRLVDASMMDHATTKLSGDGNTLFVSNTNKGLEVYRYEQRFWLQRSNGLPDNYEILNMDLSSDGRSIVLCNQNERRAEVYELRTPYLGVNEWEKTIDFHLEDFGVTLVGRACTMSGDGMSVGTSGWTSGDFSVGAVGISQRVDMN